MKMSNSMTALLLVLWAAANCMVISCHTMWRTFQHNQWAAIPFLAMGLLLLETHGIIGVMALVVAIQTALIVVMLRHGGLVAKDKFAGLDTTPNTTTYTLEQEVVKRVTAPNFNRIYVRPSWSPMPTDVHGAARVRG